MSRFLLFICLCGIARANAQVSIYDCSLYPDLTQGMIDSAGTEFYRPCIEMDNNFNFTGSSNKTIISGSPMHLRAGFHAGGFDSMGMLHLKVKPKADFDVAVMNYSGLGSVLRYEKLELGVSLPPHVLEMVNNFVTESSDTNKLNPFLEWELRVHAVFNKDGSNVQEFVDGFYYREMARDSINDTWTDEGTDYPFRIRFAPPLNGKWTCVVLIELYGDGSEIYESDPFPIKVIESGNPGFAKVHANKKNFERGGEIFYPVGTNLPFDGGPGSEFKQWTNNATYLEDYPMSYWERYVHLVDSYGTEGGKYIRIMNAAPTSEVEFEKLGNYYDRLMFASEMDRLLDVCHNNGTMIDFCLMYHTPMTLQHDADLGYAWDYGDYLPGTYGTNNRPAYCYSTAFNSTDPMDMIYNEEAFKYMKQRYRYYISRYGYSTDIYMFDLINEPWHLSQNTDLEIDPYKEDASAYGDSVRAAVYKMQKGLSDYIKLTLEHKQHLLGAIGFLSNSYPNYDKESGDKTVNDLSWEAENIDIVCINNYGSRPDKLIINKKNHAFGNDNNGFEEDENSFAYSFHQLYELYNKPVFMTEEGQAVEGPCINDEHAIDVMRYGFTGLAGFNMWSGWRYGASIFDDRTLWPIVIRAQQHMNGDDVIGTISNESGQWLQGREEQEKEKEGINEEFVEQQYFVSYDQESCVGYVYNRTYNAHTCGCDTLIFPTSQYYDLYLVSNLDKKMHIQGLKDNTDYKIEWYSYKYGDYLGYQCINTSGEGDTPLEHPNLFVDSLSPLLWYVVKMNCESGRGVGDSKNEESLKELSNENLLMVSPNPFNDHIALKANAEIGNIIIRDAQGKIVKEEYIYNEYATINAFNLRSGVYFLFSSKWNATYKIVKL